MSLSPPARRILWWLSAALWTAVIFLTLPYAPIWRDWIYENLPVYFIPVTVASLILVVMIITLTRMIRRCQPASDYFLLVLCIAGYAYSLSKIKILVEQVHFLEYGLLAYLIITALRVDRRDSAQYLNALFIISLIGLVDEYVQGVLINRVGELHDVYLNILSGALAMVWHRFCIRPIETPSDWRAALKFTLPAAGLIIIVIAVFNSRISEFGYRIEDPEIGVFYTRIPPEKQNGDYADSAFFKREILPLLYRSSYAELLHIVKNPAHREILVHIFRRDKRSKGGDHLSGHRENQILEKYFSSYIDGTEHRWTAEKAAQVASACSEMPGELYISPVSQHIITSFTEVEQWRIVIAAETLIIAAFFYIMFRRKNPNQQRVTSNKQRNESPG